MGDLSKDFDRSEFKCKCLNCSFDTVDAILINYLQLIRDHFKAPITILSGCRCRPYNVLVGGGVDSQHLVGRAADITVDGVEHNVVADYAETIGCAGVGRYSWGTHIDSRTKSGARW